MSEKAKLIEQDGFSWNPNFFIGITEKEALRIMKKGSPHIAESTVIAVWKQANNKSTPNKSTTKIGTTTED
jgi:hypothetical protein